LSPPPARPPVPAQRVAPADLADLAADWVRRVAAHRAAAGVYGRVTADVIATPAGAEVHLVEETTFKAAAGRPDPLGAALGWLATQSARRSAFGSTGSGRVEFSDAGGVVTFARVVETTVIAPKAT